MTDTPIKVTNRRRMAWVSAAQTALACFGVIGFAFFTPAGPATVAALAPVIIPLMFFLSWPQFAYFGITAHIDAILGRTMNTVAQNTVQSAPAPERGGE